MKVSCYDIVPKEDKNTLPIATIVTPLDDNNAISMASMVTPLDDDEPSQRSFWMSKKAFICLVVYTAVLMCGEYSYHRWTQNHLRPSTGGSDGEDQLLSTYNNFTHKDDVYYPVNEGDIESSDGSSDKNISIGDEDGTQADEEADDKFMESQKDEKADNQYVFVKLLSVGDVRPSEGSIDNVVLKINDGDNLLPDQASTFDGVAWNSGLSPDWKIFSYGTSFMTQYGTLRPWQATSSYADIYGDQEGIWTKVLTEGLIQKVSLSVSLKFGRGYTDIRRYYKMQVGLGNASDDDQSFKVVAEVIAAPTSETPGNTNWKEYTATWEASCPPGLQDIKDRHANCKAYPYQNGFYRLRFREGCDKCLEYDGDHSKCFEYCNKCDESACRAACRNGCVYMVCEREDDFKRGCNNTPPTKWKPNNGEWDLPNAVYSCPFRNPLSTVSVTATIDTPSLIPESPPDFYQIVLPRPLITSKVKLKLTGNFKGTIFPNGNSGVMELLAVLFFCDGVDVTQSVSKVEGNDETQGGAHIRRPINLVRRYEVVSDPPDPWGQWGPGSDVFDQGPQGQGLWTGTVKMTEGGIENEELVFYFSPNQNITDISIFRNKDDEYRERFPRKIEVEAWP